MSATILTLFYILAICSDSLASNPDPVNPTPSTVPSTTLAEGAAPSDTGKVPKTGAKTEPKNVKNATDPSLSSGEEGVVGEVNRLLAQLRQVAGSLQEAREEHERLSSAVAQVTASLRQMGDHNLHIKKKVRKISKGLKKSATSKRIKEGLKALARDHQRILHAISLSANVSANHTRGHSRNKKKSHDKKSQKSKSKKKKNVKSGGDKNGEVGEKKGGVGEKGGVVEGNVIPEMVVEPPGATETAPTTPVPENCNEVMREGNWTDGAYYIQPPGLKPIKVWCDHSTNGGGWTVILARLEQNDQENFVRGWQEYKDGFGDPAGEHWLGLDALHSMTQGRTQELRVNITDWHNNTAWAEWKEFSVGSEEDKYELTVERYTSDSVAGDALKWHNKMKFSTPDRDNDVLLGGHCAKKNDGGWWYRGYRGCYQAHPTGQYQTNPGDPPKTSVTSRNFELGPVLVWQNWRGESYYPKTLFLMFRPSLN